MHIIRDAVVSDTAAINAVTKKAFALYRDELHSLAPVVALTETDDTVKFDILNNRVIVAEENGVILGAIRYKKLNDQLAYIYRFGVDPEINNTGLGSDLLNAVIDECSKKGFLAITLHTNSKYYRLARYYYGKQFYVHSTSFDKGYIRALFVKELSNKAFDVSPAFSL